ncbi:hypothetical protein DRL16_22460 [Salmonella enterica subsp. enterica serovar Bredeney]|nr:hypothetical protein [Salmonella enterica subsp. enterica serovar Bredeney]
MRVAIPKLIYESTLVSKTTHSNANVRVNVPLAGRYRHEDEMEDFKEMVAKLLEDARRLQQIEPNAGTQARIQEAENLLARETTHD